MIDFLLAKDFSKKHIIADLPLCKLMLDDNANYPWFILIPRIANIVEITDLKPSQRKQMWFEIEEITQAVQNLFNPDKMNIATIGNITPQLHIHIIARFKTDFAWPKPVWGEQNKKEYTLDQVEKIKKDMYLPIFL